MQNSGLNDQLTYYLADVYAWTIDFFRLQKGDRFKVIYTEKFVDDSISIGIQEIKAAYFEHNGKPLYAFQFESDSLVGRVDYFNDQAKNLRRAFLKAPVKFSRISSRYNLRRRIKYYGNRIKPHRELTLPPVWEHLLWQPPMEQSSKLRIPAVMEIM